MMVKIYKKCTITDYCLHIIIVQSARTIRVLLRGSSCLRVKEDITVFDQHDRVVSW